jgi:hypothetical protein
VSELTDAFRFNTVLVNISVYCIWIPARLQVSERYEFLNTIWDRFVLPPAPFV